MLPRHHPDRIRIAFDDHRLVTNAGLVLPATLALRLGLPQLVDRCQDLGCAQVPLFCCPSGQGIIDAHQVLSSRRSRAAKPWFYSTARTASPA